MNKNTPSRLRLSKAGEASSKDDPSDPPRAPFCEPTAQKLCAALLADSLEQTHSLLAAALHEDPSFLLWTHTAAVRAGEPEDLSEDALTRWLVERCEKGDILLFLEKTAADLPLSSDFAEKQNAPFSGFAELFPVLAKKMGQLKALQTDFAEALQHKKLSALAELAAGAGHEINNPLTVIAGRAQLLLREETNPERRHALALMNTQAMRVYEMIADMMLFARPPQPQRAKLDLNQLLDDVVHQMQPLADRQETELSIKNSPLPLEEGQGVRAEVPENGPHPSPLRAPRSGRGEGTDEPFEITADAVQLMVAVKALVQNSLEALGSGGHVELELRTSGTDIEILVRDDGPGIPAEVRPHVFDPFYSARQAGRGLGMGLAKAWRIVTLHDGRINVESQPGPGATFCITLPR